MHYVIMNRKHEKEYIDTHDLDVAILIAELSSVGTESTIMILKNIDSTKPTLGLLYKDGQANGVSTQPIKE